MRTSKARKIEIVDSTATGSIFDPAAAAADRRWVSLGQDAAKSELYDRKARRNASVYQRNIESYIGTVNIPVGIAGPLRINGRAGPTEYRVPLATTEAALVASYNRGSRLLTDAGGCNARVVAEAVSRAPVFAFDNLTDAESFANFITTQSDNLLRARSVDFSQQVRRD